MTAWKYLKNQKGFTLIQLIMGLVVGGILAGVTSEILYTQANSYHYIADKKETMSDVRYALNRFSSELMRMQDEADITGVSSTDIQFLDLNGSTVHYELDNDADTGTMALFRNNVVILSHVDDLEFTFYNADGDEITGNAENMADIRRIKMQVTTEDLNGRPGVTLTTAITPRIFLGYNEFQ